MKERLLLRKTCSIHASDLHFATVIFPYVKKELEENATVRTILEKNEKENIEKISKNIGLNSQIKEKIEKIDWEETDITKIRRNFKLLENDIKVNKKIDLIVLGSNTFINKVNKAVDLWVKNNMDKIAEGCVEVNVINCFSLEEKQEVEKILNLHDYVLKTTGLEEIITEQELLKAN